MATATGSWNKMNGYNGGWNGWVNLSELCYAGSSSYATVVRFTAPSFSGISSNISFTIGFSRAGSGGATSGTFYISLCDYDPSFSGSYYPSSYMASTTLSWSAPYQYRYVSDTCTINTSSLTSGKTYYLYITSSKTVQIGGDKDGDCFGSGPTVTYAIPTYEIKFDPNGGMGGPGTLIKTYGTNLTVPTNQIPIRAGYHFVEWNTKADGSGYGVQPGGNITENVSKTMYAIWKIAASVVTLYLPNENGIIEKKRGMMHMYNSDGNLRYAIMTIYDETGKRYLAN